MVTVVCSPDGKSSLGFLFIHLTTEVPKVPENRYFTFLTFLCILSLWSYLERPKSDILVFLLWSTRIFLAARSLGLSIWWTLNICGLSRKWYWYFFFFFFMQKVALFGTCESRLWRRGTPSPWRRHTQTCLSLLRSKFPLPRHHLREET